MIYPNSTDKKIIKTVLLSLFILVPQIYAGALKNIKKCSDGDPLACYHTGMLFEEGKGTKPNLSKAKRYYKKSCTLGYGTGCNHVAKILRKEKKYQSAFNYYLTGCHFNQANACYDLASLYKEGKGIHLNYKKAKQYYKKACRLGNKTSCKNYAYLDRNGI